MTTVQPRTAMTPLAPSDQRTGSPSPATSNGGVQVPAAHIADQSVTTTFHVEVMTDLEHGTPTLIGSSDPNHGDLQVVTADQVIAKAREQHRLIDQAVQLAVTYEAATGQAPAVEPRTWVVAERDTGMPLKVTCMRGCNELHLEAESGMVAAEDVVCTQYDVANTVELRIGCGTEYDDGEWTTLSVQIDSAPFHPDEAKRVPHAAVEVTQDHFIEGLDPDGLAVVIDKLQQRVDAMRIRHTDLVRARNEYFRQQA